MSQRVPKPLRIRPEVYAAANEAAKAQDLSLAKIVESFLETFAQAPTCPTCGQPIDSTDLHLARIRPEVLKKPGR